MKTTMEEPETRQGAATSCPCYQRKDLELFNVLAHPVYVFDVERKAMWWANKAALVLWNAETLESLLQRSFSKDMGDANSKRLNDCLRRIGNGETFTEAWTLYPGGKGPVTTYVTSSGILVNDDEEHSGGRLAALCEGDMPREQIDNSSLCSVEMLQTKLKEANRACMAKAQFVAITAHEIRTPLHQVMGFMELLEKTKLTSQQAEYVALMENSALSLMAVVNDILDYSKLEVGKMKLEHIPFIARDVLLGSLDMIRSKATSKGLVLEHHFSKLIPEKIVGDPSRIRQLLLNLLQNGVKFTENGMIALTVTRGDTCSDTKNRLLLRIEVKDTGIGISPQSMKHIFNDYQQADETISRTYGGTGLGLAICKRLTEAMSGSIGVESEIGRGSTFRLEIPFDLPDPVEKIDCCGTAIPEALTEPNEAARVLRILVVEDNVSNQKVIQHMLEMLKHDVTVADNGLKALDKVERATFDLILMDIYMPIMDGIEATQELRRRGWTLTKLPIIGLTADFQPSERSKYLDVGMNDCLGKPIRMAELQSFLGKSSLFRIRQVEDQQTVA